MQNGSHTRTFSYDSLSRLLTASNPENGTITYTYNPDGTLLTKTDARSITASYSYDGLHRILGITYSNGDPSLGYTYDGTNCLGLSSCQNIGYRTGMTDAAGSESWAYMADSADSRSIHRDQRTTDTITKTTTYYLDLAGNITQLNYPTGRVVNYAYNGADRPISAADSANGINYATGWATPPSGTACVSNEACYTPQGSIYGMAIGKTSTFAGVDILESFNNRLQPNEIKATSTGGTALDIKYNFTDSSGHNAGHVYGINNLLNSSRSQSFSYDQVNRIVSGGTSATSGSYCWGYQYSYDAWGNLTAQAGWSPTYNSCSQNTMAATADSSNHLSSLSYDASGNTLSDGINSYAWDGESQMKTAAGVTYTYDGDGHRVAKSSGKLYWFGAGGEILAETDTSGTVTAEYIFFGGRRTAMLPAGATAQYYIEDFLGTSRVVTNNTGTVCYDADFTPFGAERAYTNNCAQNAYKFEGKERDAETGNDNFGARSYAWRLGRWLSSDWSSVPTPVPYANLTNPQTLNLYAMVADDPQSFADLDGHDTTAAGLQSGAGDVSSVSTGGSSGQKPNPSQPPPSANPLPPPPLQKARQQEPQDITPQQGESILKEAQSYAGTPYTQNLVPPNNTRGQKGPGSGIDCSHMVCFAAHIPYASANALQHSKFLRPLKPSEQRQAADVVIFVNAKGHGFHVAFWDPNPPRPGYNVYGATSGRNNPNGNLQWLPLTNHGGQSTFGGTPTFYRIVIP